MIQAFAAWTLSLMALLLPPASVPWGDTYEATANAIATDATSSPIFGGDDGVARTIAIDVEMAYKESRFDPRARGDGGRSVGLYQTQPRTASVPPDSLTDPDFATAIANYLMARSLALCGRYPEPERLAWYMLGGDGCGNARTRRMSAARFGRAMRMVADHPPPVTDRYGFLAP